VAELVLEEIFHFTQPLLKNHHGWRHSPRDKKVDAIVQDIVLVNAVAEQILVEVVYFAQLLVESLH